MSMYVCVYVCMCMCIVPLDATMSHRIISQSLPPETNRVPDALNANVEIPDECPRNVSFDIHIM